jgi:hypothetical protein
MILPVPVSRVAAAAHQRGQGFFIAVLLLLVGVSAVIYTFATRASAEISRDKATAAALAQARDAIIGYAAAHTDQPGVLPCPDSDNDGSADSPCEALGVTAIGRLPWKTLGLESLRDGSGECLWYAVSGNFKNSGVSGPAVVNSDSAGTLAVYNSNGSAAHAASKVAAIVFAPGETMAGQDRTPAGTTICGGNVDAAAYLDSYTAGATTYNNATGTGTNSFVTAPADTASRFNDKLLPLTTTALFAVVERRVLREMRTALRTYRAVNGYFPSANPYGVATYNCSYTSWQARLPLNVNAGCGAWADWAGSLPAWFGTNNWQQVTYYAVSACRVGTVPIAIIQNAITTICNVATPADLTVAGTPNIHAVVFTAGAAIAALGQARPCANVSACLDDAANRDGNSIFVQPVASATNNDRVLIVWP